MVSAARQTKRSNPKVANPIPVRFRSTHVTTREAMEQTGLSYESLRRRCKDYVFEEGRDYFKHGRLLLWKKTALDRYLKRLSRPD